MGSELVVSGVTFGANIGKSLPAIAGLQSVGWFGTGYSNNSGNRVPGGPAFVTPNGPPTYSPNYVTVGGASYLYLDTQLPRTAAVVASGWTWITVFRVPSTGNPSLVMGDAGASGANTLRIRASNATNALSVDANATLLGAITPSSALTNWHCAALTVAAGGGTAGVNLYDLTDNQQVAVSTPISTNAANSPHIGASGLGTEGGTINTTADVAALLVAFSPLTLVQCQAIYTSLKSLLAFRNIAC